MSTTYKDSLITSFAIWISLCYLTTLAGTFSLWCCCCCLVIKSCPTLSDPWTVTCQAPLSIGFPRQEYWSGLLFPSSGALPGPGLSSCLLHWQVDSLPLSHQGSTYTVLLAVNFGKFCLLKAFLIFIFIDFWFLSLKMFQYLFWEYGSQVCGEKEK